MPINNVTIDDLFSVNISVFSSGIAVDLPWQSGVTEGPLIGRNEVRTLTQYGNSNGLQKYIDLRSRFDQIKNLARTSYTVVINGIEYDSSNRDELNSLLDTYAHQFDSLMQNFVNTTPMHNSIISRQINESKPGKRAGASYGSAGTASTDRPIPNSVAQIKRVRERAELNAANALIGPNNNALQIGWMSFGPEDAGPNVIRLGPDKISFADFNNVNTTNTVRSDTEIAIKGSNGRALLDIDIIFPSVDHINGHATRKDGATVGQAGLRELLGMLRMSPVITVGGKAIGAALLNSISASESYEDIRDLFFENAGREREELFDLARTQLGDKFEITFGALSSVLKSERDTYDLLQRHFNAEKKSKEIKSADIEYSQGKPPTRKDFVDSLNIHSVLIPLVCQSITTSTIGSAPGAIRVRLSMQKYHNPYEPAGGLAFYDEFGDGTYDARKAQPLRDGVFSVYLSPQRSFPTIDGTVEYRDNVYYIPRIGDTTDGSLSKKTIAGFDRKGGDSPRYKVNEMGFMTYAPVVSKDIGISDDDYSPIMFRFSAASDPIQSYEYIPNNMVLQNVSWHYANKIASFPMEGEIYPGFQYMGRASVTASLSFSTTSEKAVQQFFTVKNVMDQHATINVGPEILRREYLDCYNDILLLSGISRWVMSSARMETDPDHPGLYHLQVELVSNEESIHKRERVKKVSGNAPDSKLRALWWWMYAGLFIKFNQVLRTQYSTEGAKTYLRSLPSPGFGKLFTEGWDGDFTSAFDKILGGEFGFDDGAVNPQASALASFGGGNAFGPIGVVAGHKLPGSSSVPGLGKEASHTQEEVDAIWRMVFGGDYDLEFKPGFMDQHMFRAAFMEFFRKGDLNIPRVSTATLFPKKFGSTDPGGSAHSNLGTYLAWLLDRSRQGARNATDDEEDRDVAIGEAGDWISVHNWINRIANYYDNERETWGSSSVASNTHKQTTPWWIVNPMYSGGSAGTVSWLKNLAKIFEKGVPKTDRQPDVFQANISGNVAWLPTPEMWSKLYWVMTNWSQLSDSKDKKYGYEVQRHDSAGDVHLFRMSKNMKFAKKKLSEVASNPRYRRFLPTFWRKFGAAPADFLTKIDPVGKSIDLEFRVDPEVYELRNNYIDLPMPRYFEIFSHDFGSGTSPQPRVDAGGYEVWRKIAPSYLELGIKPTMYSSLTALTESDEVSVKSPHLLTPRAFFDYCDPGYFYYRKSWLVDQYNQIKESIDSDIKNGSLSPLGDDPSSGFGLSATEQQRLDYMEGEGNPNFNVIQIARADFSLDAFIEPQAGADKSGVRTTNVRGSVDWGNISTKFSKMAKKELEYELSKHLPGSTNAGLDKLYKVVIGRLPRVFVLDSTGRKVGMIVSKSGSHVTTGGTVKKLDNISELMQKRGYSVRTGDDINTADLYYVDLTSYLAQTPSDITYQDHQGVLSHNTYDPEGAKELYISTLENMGDQTQNHMRAYPTFKLYFVKERVEGDQLITTLEEDMYGYNSVISIDVSLDKEDADVAKIVVTDISGNLSTATFDTDTEILKEIPGVPNHHTSTAGSIHSTTDDDQNIFVNDDYEKIKLEVGTNILVKMGYGNDSDTLKTVFTGAIAEIQNGPITTIVAQGYKSELYRQVNLYSQKGFADVVGDMITNNGSIGPINANYLVFRVLQELSVLPAHGGHDSAGGIPHLGRFISLTQFERLHNTVRDRFSSEFQSSRDVGLDPGSGVDAGLAWGTTALFAAGALISRGRTGGKLLGGVAGLSIANNLSGANVISSGLGYLRKYSSEFMHTNSMRNVFFSNDVRSDSWMDFLSQEWLVDGDGWNALKEISRYKLGHVCQVVPYGSNATLFMGNPSSPYHYKPLTGLEISRYSMARPFQEFASFSVLYNSLFAKFFSSGDYGLNTLRSDWSTFSYFNSTATSTFKSPASLAEHHDLETYMDKIGEFLAISASKVSAKEAETLTNLMGTSLFNETLPFLQNIGIFPSYTISRYVLQRLRGMLGAGGTISDDEEIRTWSPKRVFGITGRGNEDVKTNSDDDEISFSGDLNDDLIILSNSFKYTESGGTKSAGGSDGFGIKQAFNVKDYLFDWDGYTSSDNITVPVLSSVSPAGDAGYSVGDHWAVTLSGRLISKTELEDRFGIDPKTGKPKYSYKSLARIPRRLAAGKYSHLSRKSEIINFATTEGYGAFRLDKSAFSNPDLRYFRFSGRDAKRTAHLFTKTATDHMVVVTDHSDDLEYIRGYGDDLEKILFSIFFGLTWVKGEGGKPQFLYFGDELDRLYRSYGSTIMTGIGASDGISSWLSTGDKLQALWDKLQNSKYGILAPLNITQSGRQIMYENYAVSGNVIDGSILEDGAEIFKAEIENMVLNGKIRPEEADVVRDRFKKFVQLASSGLLSSVFADNVYDAEGVAESAKIFSFDDKKTSIEVGKRLSDYSTLIDKIMSQDASIDPDLRDAFTVLIGRSPGGSDFDANNIGDLISLRETLNSFSVSHTNLTSVKSMTANQRKALTKALDKVEMRSDGTLNADAYSNLVATATSGSISEEVLSDLSKVETPAVLAFGAQPGISMYKLLLQNCDYYKTFLIFFAKWLRNSGNSEKSLRSMKVHEATKKIGSGEIKPGQKRFQDVHYIVSGVDIIENSITHTMSEMANNILLMTPEDIEVQVMNDENSPKPIYKFDQYNTKMIPYPNYQYNGVDWNSYVRPELRKQRLVIERNAETDQQRMALLINHMAEAIRPMYRGHLTVTGRVIKPHDRVVLIDSNKSIFGIIEVERVTHSFNGDAGWTTTIIPCAFVNPMEPSKDLMAKFDTSNISAMLTGLGVAEWLLDIWFWAGIILAPFSAGASLGATASAAAARTGISQVGKRAAGGFMKNMVASAARRAMSGAARVGLAGTRVFGGKAASAGLKNSLLRISRSGLGNNANLAFSALARTSIDSFIGKRATYYASGVLTSEVAKWGAGLYMNQATDMILRGGTLPIHTYCLTRLGKPIHAGLDMDVSTWYSWDERFGHTVDGMTDKIGKFFQEAFTINNEELDTFTDVFLHLENG